MTASMNRDLIELYSDYLLSSFSKTTATGLSERQDNQYSHDRITRLLSSNNFSSTTLWRYVKPVVRKIEAPDGILIVDDTIEGKACTKENALKPCLFRSSVVWQPSNRHGKNVPT